MYFKNYDGGDKKGLEFDSKSKNRLIVRSDGKVFAILDKLVGIYFQTDHFKGAGKITSKYNLTDIGYTTKRDNEIIRYNHKFTKFAAPQVRSSSSHIIKSFGGRFEFTELGFTDKKA